MMQSVVQYIEGYSVMLQKKSGKGCVCTSTDEKLFSRYLSYYGGGTQSVVYA